MTRINLGIKPAELCDQHLIAEYRELPRMRAFAQSRLDRLNGPGPRPEAPTLGTGHMAYFTPYGVSLEQRFTALVEEMRYRGFEPNLAWRPYPDRFNQVISPEHERQGRRLLQQRLREKLANGMKSTWTRRQRPAWCA